MARNGLKYNLLELLGRAVPYDLNYTNLKLLGVEHLSFRISTNPFELIYRGSTKTSHWEHVDELSFYSIDHPKPLAPFRYLGKFCGSYVAEINTPGFEYKYCEKAYMVFDQPYIAMMVSDKFPREIRIRIIHKGMEIDRRVSNDRITLEGSLEDVRRAFEYFWDLRRQLQKLGI